MTTFKIIMQVLLFLGLARIIYVNFKISAIRRRACIHRTLVRMSLDFSNQFVARDITLAEREAIYRDQWLINRIGNIFCDIDHKPLPEDIDYFDNLVKRVNDTNTAWPRYGFASKEEFNEAMADVRKEFYRFSNGVGRFYRMLCS